MSTQKQADYEEKKKRDLQLLIDEIASNESCILYSDNKDGDDLLIANGYTRRGITSFGDQWWKTGYSGPFRTRYDRRLNFCVFSCFIAGLFIFLYCVYYTVTKFT